MASEKEQLYLRLCAGYYAAFPVIQEKIFLQLFERKDFVS